VLALGSYHPSAPLELRRSPDLLPLLLQVRMLSIFALRTSVGIGMAAL